MVFLDRAKFDGNGQAFHPICMAWLSPFGFPGEVIHENISFGLKLFAGFRLCTRGTNQELQLPLLENDRVMLSTAPSKKGLEFREREGILVGLHKPSKTPFIIDLLLLGAVLSVIIVACTRKTACFEQFVKLIDLVRRSIQ